MTVQCYLLAALILLGLANAQDLTCDNLPQDPGTPCIEHTATTQAMLGPLYPAGSTVVVILEPGGNTGVDVTNGVEVYIDCGGLVMAPEGGGSPPEVFFLRNNDLLMGTTELEFHGTNEEILRIVNAQYALGAVLGSQGTYFCYVCPAGTTPPVGGNIDPACLTNGTILLTVLPDLPEVCTGSNDDVLMFVNEELPVKPGRNFVCLTENPDPHPRDFALINGEVGSNFANYLLFICTLAPGLTVPGHVATASFNGEDIFQGDTIFPMTALCPGDADADTCGVFEYNDDPTIGFSDGITNAQLDQYYGTFTCTITVENVDVSVSASVITSNCAPPVITTASSMMLETGRVQIGAAACVNSVLLCEVSVSFGTPYNVTWMLNGAMIGTISEGDQIATYEITADQPGTYTCFAENAFGNDTASSEVYAPPSLLSSTLVGNASDSGCGRVTDGNLFDLCPALNEMVQFDCQFETGIPAFVLDLAGNLSLYDNMDNVVPSSAVTFSSSAQDGIYSCQADNPVCSSDPARENFDVAVHDAPQINVNYVAPSATLFMVNLVAVVGQNDSKSFSVGQSLALLCPYTGIQQPTVQWYINDSLVDQSDMRIGISDRDESSIFVSVLTIMNLMSSDIGNYECRVSNNVIGGEVAESINLVEVDVPRPILTITIIDRNGQDLSSTSCERLNPRPPDTIVSCPFVGENVIVSCVSSVPTAEVTLYVPPNRTMHSEDSITTLSIQEGGIIPDGMYSCQLNGDTDDKALQLYDPPQVSRTVPLPPTPEGGVVVGVGRSQGEEVPIPEGNDAILFFPYTGLDEPSATFFQLQDGVFVEIENGTGPYLITADPGGNGFILTIMNFSSENAGTYMFVATNAAGEASATSTLIVEREMVWFSSPWSQCEPDCHAGIRQRKVMCKEIPGNILRPDNQCPNPKPHTTETCDHRGPCYLTPQWGHGDWSKCSQPCGGGYRERDVFCVIPRTGVEVEHSQCMEHSLPPINFEYCNLHPCCSGDQHPSYCAMIRGTAFCAIAPYNDICCWTCSGGAEQQ